MEASPSPTNHYLAKVIVSVTVSGVVAPAAIVTPNVNTLVVPAPTEAAEGEVNVASVDEEVTVGFTVSASWPEFATVIRTAPTSPAKTLPLQAALSDSVEVVQETLSRARSPFTVATLIERGSFTLSVVVTDKALKA